MEGNAIDALQVTVIVPTRNRAALLKELIESLWDQSLAPEAYEIIVVDNQSTDATPQMIAGMQHRSPCPLIYHRAEQNRGPIHSRNLAARLARSEILAFIDSDCRASRRWLERAVAGFREHPQAAFISGAVLDKPEQPVKFFCFRNGAVPGQENFTYPACNIAYSKSAFQEFGGFDEGEYVRDVGDKPIECADTDLAWRMRKAGRLTLYDDDMVVYHEVTPMTPWQWLKSQTRVMMVPMAVRLHPQLREKICWWGPFFRIENSLFYLAVAALALAAAVNAWWALLALPYGYHGLTIPGPRFTPARIPRLAGRVVLLTVRQAVICGSLVYGSFRTRTLVL